jgi:hypothetical protein
MKTRIKNLFLIPEIQVVILITSGALIGKGISLLIS